MPYCLSETTYSSKHGSGRQIKCERITRTVSLNFSRKQINEPENAVWVGDLLVLITMAPNLRREVAWLEDEMTASRKYSAVA